MLPTIVIAIMIVNCRFLQRPKMRSRRNQLIHWRLPKTKSMSYAGQDQKVRHTVSRLWWRMIISMDLFRGGLQVQTKERTSRLWLDLCERGLNSAGQCAVMQPFGGRHIYEDTAFEGVDNGLTQVIHRSLWDADYSSMKRECTMVTEFIINSVSFGYWKTKNSALICKT